MAEDTIRSNREIKASSLGETVLKKFALPKSLFKAKQCSRLKQRILNIVEGDIETQFATLISRLENLKTFDPRTRIRVRLTPVTICLKGMETFARNGDFCFQVSGVQHCSRNRCWNL